MTSRERVRAVLNHETPDKVPCGLGGCETAGLHVLAYDKLQSVLNVKRQQPRVDTFMFNAIFEQPVLEAAGCDILLLASPRMCKSRLWGRGSEAEWKEQSFWNKSFRISKKESFTTLPDGTAIWTSAGNMVCPPGSTHFDAPPQPMDLSADIKYMSPDDFNPPMELDEALLRSLEDTARQMFEETGYSLCMGETITDLQVSPGGIIGDMLLMLEDPETFKAFLQKSLDSGLSQLKMLDQAVGKYVDILSIAHDFGDNKCVTIGAPLWRSIYKPFYAKLFAGWKQRTKMKVNFHSCGSVESILDDLIECGVDIYNPVQISANNMSPESLKARFGDRLIFWGGGYDAHEFSPQDSYEKVYQTVGKRIGTFKPDGGYIFSGVHNLQSEVPEHHLKAMLDAFKDNR
jgi:uroporphyrinogen decarboxylase